MSIFVLMLATAFYQPCTLHEECGDQGYCEEGVCSPDQECKTAADCPAPPTGYSVVCEKTWLCEDFTTACRLGPNPSGNCPGNLVNEDGLCVKDLS